MRDMWDMGTVLHILSSNKKGAGSEILAPFFVFFVQVTHPYVEDGLINQK